MENQHREITGYRELTEQEIALMNEGKALAEQCREYIEKLDRTVHIDKRAVALGRSHLQTGFMWAIRGIAQPTTF